MSEAVSNKRRKLEERLIEKAKADPGFKAALINDPRTTLESELKLTIPQGIEVEVLEEKANKVYLVLPVDPSDMELPEGLLKNVAGGICSCDFPGSCDSAEY